MKVKGALFFLFWSIRTQDVNQVPVGALRTSLQASIINDQAKPRTEKEKRFFPKYITLHLYLPWVLKPVIFQIKYYVEFGWSETTLDQITARFKWHLVQAPSYIGIMTSGHVCLFIKTPNDGEFMNSQYSPQIFGKLC